jgi:uncharacterized protein (DUF305 family)
MNEENQNIAFIDMMIPHHKAAINMVKKFKGKINNSDLIQIMNNIVTSQTEEIDKMETIKSLEQENNKNSEMDILNNIHKVLKTLNNI